MRKVIIFGICGPMFFALTIVHVIVIFPIGLFVAWLMRDENPAAFAWHISTMPMQVLKAMAESENNYK